MRKIASMILMNITTPYPINKLLSFSISEECDPFILTM